MQSPLALRAFYRRNLPHIVRADRLLFVTFTTLNRWILPPGARTIALRHALHEHLKKIFMRVAIVMPDHVHLIFTLLHDQNDVPYSLGEVMKGIKGVSARRINQLMGRSGNLWLDESFDHVIRNFEHSQSKLEYVCDNPVRAGLVRSANEYPWLWRVWIEGRANADMQAG
jgi:REP element-mobilizing transposase RayT